MIHLSLPTDSLTKTVDKLEIFSGQDIIREAAERAFDQLLKHHASEDWHNLLRNYADTIDTCFPLEERKARSFQQFMQKPSELLPYISSAEAATLAAEYLREHTAVPEIEAGNVTWTLSQVAKGLALPKETIMALRYDELRDVFAIIDKHAETGQIAEKRLLAKYRRQWEQRDQQLIELLVTYAELRNDECWHWFRDGIDGSPEATAWVHERNQRQAEVRPHMEAARARITDHVSGS